jgi:hypothetical protein
MTISADLIGFNHPGITSQVVSFSKEKAVIRPSCTNMQILHGEHLIKVVIEFIAHPCSWDFTRLARASKASRPTNSQTEWPISKHYVWWWSVISKTPPQVPRGEIVVFTNRSWSTFWPRASSFSACFMSSPPIG